MRINHIIFGKQNNNIKNNQNSKDSILIFNNSNEQKQIYEYTKDLQIALRMRNTEAIVSNISEIISANSPELLCNVVKNLEERDINLALELCDKLPISCKNEYLDRLQMLAKDTPAVYNNFLAVGIFDALNNGNYTNSSNLLMKINEENILEIDSIYLSIAEKKNEIAANKKEKNILKNMKLKYNDVKIRAKRTETLLQGILNQTNVTLEEKRNNLKIVLEMYIQKAEKNDVHQEKIDKFKEFAEKEINYVTSKEYNRTQNALYLERQLNELFE